MPSSQSRGYHTTLKHTTGSNNRASWVPIRNERRIRRNRARAGKFVPSFRFVDDCVLQFLTVLVWNRKERNCAAQKAYRQRQTLYVRELEEKLRSSSQSENDRVQDLEKSNRRYRHELLEAYKKLESTRISLDGVLTSIASAIGIQVGDLRRSPSSKADMTSAEQNQQIPETGRAN